MQAKLSRVLWSAVAENSDQFQSICGVPYTALPLATVSLSREREVRKRGSEDRERNVSIVKLLHLKGERGASVMHTVLSAFTFETTSFVFFRSYLLNRTFQC